MKRWMTFALAALMMLACSCALGELGFAEIKKDNVNVRETAGGKTLWQLDSPQSVYVYEEKTVGKYLWCHVSTYIGKNPRTGWIRGDMLRFLSDEFYDIVDVVANRTYVMGLRSDGTVAILGDDMPHAPCIETVRKWKSIRQIGTYVCSAYGLTDKGVVRAVGLQDNFDGMKASHIGQGYPYPMDAKGRFLYDIWEGIWEGNANWEFWMGKKLLGDTPLITVIGETLNPEVMLTKDGKVLVIDHTDTARHFEADVPYVDLSGIHTHTVALRADGRVETIVSQCVRERCVVCEQIQSWTDIVQVEAAGEYVLGRRSDGTVLYAGKNEQMARQVAGWTSVIDIAAEPESCIALFEGGSVAMAGHHHEGYFR